MLCYIYDYNNIKVVPMKFSSASEWVKAYDSIHQELTVKGFKPKLQTLDNEASTAWQNFFTVNDIDYQLNHVESPADISSASAALCRRALPWARGLQKKQLLPHQDAKSSHMRNQESGKLGLLTGSMDIHLVPPCIIAGVKMYTAGQRPANASWILSNYFPTIIKCHSYHPPTGY
jgi:hypothetical protein